MARYDFRLKGLHLFSLVLVWALTTAALFLLGLVIGYRSEAVLPATPETEVTPDATEPASKPSESPQPTASAATGTTRLAAEHVVPSTDGALLPEPSEARTESDATTREAPDTPFGNEILQTASRYNINPALVAAIVWMESDFDPDAVSHKGAVGLMQVMPQTAVRFGYDANQLGDPVANLSAGSEYLNWLSDRYPGDLALILGSYNAGEGAVDRYGGMPPYPETRRYVRKVLAAFRHLDDDPEAGERIN